MNAQQRRGGPTGLLHGFISLVAFVGIGCGDAGPEADDVDRDGGEPGAVDGGFDPVIVDTHPELRVPLTEYVWERTAIPSGPLPQLEPITMHPDYGEIPGLASMHRMRFSMEYGLESIGVYMEPVNARNRLIIYHSGHCTPCWNAEADILFFLERGYSVIELWMPVYGQNPPVTIEVNGQSLRLENHNDFRVLDAQPGSALRFFLEPVAQAVDFAEQELGLGFVDLVGLSGGAWTITVYAAMDARVRHSFPVAGTLPFELLGIDPNGHYELDRPPSLANGASDQPFYDIAGIEDLYVLGGLGEGRSQVQILNAYDTCCFTADPIRDEIRAYEQRVQARLSELGTGQFRVVIDESIRTHAISRQALEIMEATLEGR